MRTGIVTSLLLISFFAFGQSYDNEALLYSHNQIAGSARSIGVGGAFGAIGADLGCLNINPAGLGLYRSTDFSASPGLMVGYNKGSYLGGTTNASSSNIYFGQAGLAFTKMLQKESKPDEISFNPQRVKSFTIAVNFQRQNFYSRKIQFSGTNSSYSNAGSYANYLNYTMYPIDFNNYSPELVLMKEVDIIYRDTTDGNYYSPVPLPALQNGLVETKGSKDQIDIGFGVNVNDKVYFGLGIGIPLLNYSYASSFTEANTVASDTFNSYSVYDYLTVKGVGINTTLGLIYRPASWVRIGVAYQIPSFFNIHDTYEVDATADYDTANLGIGVKYDPLKYKFRSPMKGIVSAGFFIQQYAFISVDYEFQNDGASHYNFGKDYSSISDDENTFIKDHYGYVHTIRAGVEGAVKWFRIRAGYSFSSSPFKKSYVAKGYDQSTHNITAGFGYRGKKFYADFAFVHSMTKDETTLMALDPVQSNYASNRAMITVGWRFSKKQ